MSEIAFRFEPWESIREIADDGELLQGEHTLCGLDGRRYAVKVKQ
jgi:hypothetical protein